MQRSCANAAGRARLISRASLVCAPHIGKTAWTNATTSASTSAKCPNSTIMMWPSWRGRTPLAVFLQRGGDFGGHVFLVMLGQHIAGGETAIGAERAFHHHALTFAEKIGQDAPIDDGKRVFLVGDAKAHEGPILHHAALFHQPAQAEIP